MQQRLQIARNLVTGPRLVFMDEPTGGLDVSVQARLLDLLRGLVRDLGLSVIIVTHDLAVVRLLAHRLMVMKSGHVVEQGLTDQVLDDPAAWIYATAGVFHPAGMIMLFAYAADGAKLTQLPHSAELTEALWLDLYRPMPEQIGRVRALGVEVPTLADMEEIEISNRLYRENGADYLTVVLPGLSETKNPISGPVCFILTPGRLITVRHHAPRPFETYPTRADKVGPGCSEPRRLFLSLLEEIIGRLADFWKARASRWTRFRAMSSMPRAMTATLPNRCATCRAKAT